MHAFHRLRIYHTFFRSFYAAGGCISLCCGWLFYRWGGGSLAPLLYFKLGTTAIVYYMVHRFKHREYYYYHNLGISKRKLWAFYEFCDLLVFVLLLIAADLLPEWDTFLEIDSARMQIGDRTILEHAYLQVRSGEVVALLGRNGSGKSTLLQMLYGTRRGTFRHVRWDGQPFERVFEHPESVRYLPQFHFVSGHLSVRRVFADYQVDLASFAVDFPDLTHCADARIKHLSGGERRLIEVYLIIRSPSAICLLDEPFSQLMPLHMATLKTLIRDETKSGAKGFVITDHLYRDLLPISDRICLLQEGYVSEVSSSDKELAALGYIDG